MGPRRRKIALACEPCRRRKARCDGQKPICSACKARKLNISECLYKTSENARSASNDEYLRTLHHRIRQLEETCIKAGIAVPDFRGMDTARDSVVLDNGHNDSTVLLDEGVSSATLNAQPQQSPAHQTPNSEQANFHPTETEVYSSTPFEFDSNVTGMGAISSADQSRRSVNEYFGSSSTVSLMRLMNRVSEKRPSGTHCDTHGEIASRLSLRDQISSLTQRLPEPQGRFQVDDFLLPSRDLADHLLDCFWDRIYCLYPFFDRKSFQDAYDNLWIGRYQPGKPLSSLDIGLGNKAHSGSRSIVFICALNMAFALGCHFADIPVHEREAAAHTFFLRAKRFIGLDILDIRTVGTVQCFLLTVLFLQSTPYPHRCWHSIGVACRVAQGLGLHEVQLDDSQHPLEREIQRRTWHGCVMMDMFVSMTYGRPTMTSHLSSVPLPASPGTGSTEEQGPPVMAFYIAAIELYKILDSILSDIYKAWHSKRGATSTGSTTRQGGLDVIIDLEEKLFEYESNLPPILNWTTQEGSPSDPATQLILARQRNVLHASPDRRPAAHSTIHTSILTKCAAACVKSAVSLISLVHDTHLDSATDTWWYNGFYTSTAGMVIIMSYTCRPISDELEKATIDSTWARCEDVLRQMGSFSLSARNTLHFLKAAREQVLTSPQQLPSAAGRSTATEGQRQHISLPTDQAMEAPSPDTPGVFTWDFSMEPLASDLGFLGPIDFTELQGWLPEYFAKDKVLKGNYEPPKGFEDIINGEDLNGSFFSDYTIDDNDILTNHISWATYKAKWVKSEVVYHWVQTTILVKWEIPSNREAPSKIDILFINLEEAQRKHIIDNLPRTPREQFYAFTWHALFAESVIGLYVKTFWLLRDIRLLRVEKEIHSLRMRAKSLTERLNNEINLAFNLATISESAIMSTIGIVSMVYLPGTFVSVSSYFSRIISSD
ncbi:fungal-specific transcription factor domain-containing protein [Aspergillus ambiguus]|uniref:uncharacterized protein n=1 Tax=Aspergillus ambiguus TaxID=176160 RepID=UPI003CCD29AE